MHDHNGMIIIAPTLKETSGYQPWRSSPPQFSPSASQAHLQHQNHDRLHHQLYDQLYQHIELYHQIHHYDHI